MRGSWLAVVVLACACASPVRFPDPLPAAPIRLDPVCWPPETLTLPAAAALAAPAPREAATFRLDNGLRVLVAPRPPTGLVTLRLRLDGGTREAPALADLALRALVRRTAERDEGALRDRLADLGATLATEVGADSRAIDVTAPEQAFAAVSSLLAEIVAPRRIGVEGLAAERRRWRLAQLALDAAPDRLARRLFYRVAVSPDHPEALAASAADAPATPGDVEAYLARTVSPDRAWLLVAGAVDPAGVRREVEDAFGDWRAPPDATPPPPRPDLAPVSPEPATIHLVDRPGAAQVEILVGHATVRRTDADYAALAMLASLVGGETGGRLFRDLRERQGLAYAIGAEQRDDGAFLVSTRARHEQAPALLAGVLAHLDALARVPVEACEAARMRERMLGELLFAKESAASAQRVASARIDHGLAPDGDDLAPRFRGLDAAALTDVATRRLAGRPTIVLVGEAGWLTPVLDGRFPALAVRRYDATLTPHD